MQLRAQDRAALAERLIARWRVSPAAFCREALGFELWPRQEELIQAAAQHMRVAVRSGHKVGKSRSAAALALWFWTLFPDARVVMTSASGRQVNEVLWREVRALHRQSRYQLGGTAYEQAGRGLRHPDGRQIVGFTTNEPEKMSGISGANILYLLDEASGIGEDLFEAIEGNRAGGARIVMFSNPTRLTGSFYEAFSSKREFWHTLRISSLEASEHAIPGLATRDWIAEKEQEWGTASPAYQVRVLGEFPSQESTCVVGLHLVDKARETFTAADGRLHVGVDVARFGGDETVVFCRRGNHVYPATVLNDMDGPTVAGKVMEQVHAHWRPEDENDKPMVKVDVIGVGASVVDALGQHVDKRRVQVCPVNVAERSDAEDQYVNLRSQLWFGLRDFLAGGGHIPRDSKLEGDLVSAQYEFDARGRYKVEPKEKIKERLRRSPDRADALALCVYSPPVATRVGRRAPRRSDAKRLGRIL